MLKTIKKQGNLFLFAKLILFAGVLYLLYRQVSGFDQKAWNSFALVNFGSLFLAIVLVFPNIWLAYKKWDVTLRSLEIKTTQRIKTQSFFAGIVTGLVTPNMLGNFLGRFYYFDKEYRGIITAFTMLSNFGQFLASMTFGAVSIFLLGELLVWKEADQVVYILLFGIVISYLIYFFIDNFLGRFKQFRFAGEFRRLLKKFRWFRTSILFLSFARFVIFTLQFSLMLNAFGVNWNLYLIAAIWQVYLLTMIAPSLFLGKVGIKESIALFVLSELGLNEVSILFSTTLIWFLNTVSPGLVGLIICRNRAE